MPQLDRKRASAAASTLKYTEYSHRTIQAAVLSHLPAARPLYLYYMAFPMTIQPALGGID